jgi:hypothetical protein
MRQAQRIYCRSPAVVSYRLDFETLPIEGDRVSFGAPIGRHHLSHLLSPRGIICQFSIYCRHADHRRRYWRSELSLFRSHTLGRRHCNACGVAPTGRYPRQHATCSCACRTGNAFEGPGSGLHRRRCTGGVHCVVHFYALAKIRLAATTRKVRHSWRNLRPCGSGSRTVTRLLSSDFAT